MAETSPKASPKKAATKTVAAAKAKSVAVVQPKPAEIESAAPVAAKPATAKTAGVKKTAAVKTPAAKSASKSAAKSIVLTDEQRYRMVAEAAYYRAEKNQFKSDPLRDWIDAENDINARLNGDPK